MCASKRIDVSRFDEPHSWMASWLSPPRPQATMCKLRRAVRSSDLVIWWCDLVIWWPALSRIMRSAQTLNMDRPRRTLTT